MEQRLPLGSNTSSLTPPATFTELTKPLASVPPSELCNPIPNVTLLSHPHLFKIITPINVDHLQTLLTSHLNQPLINSVDRSL